MALHVVQTPVKTSYSIAELSKSSQKEYQLSGEAIVYNIHRKEINASTPMKLCISSSYRPLTSTPIANITQYGVGQQIKRKREDDSINSTNSSLNSSNAKISGVDTSSSDDTTDIEDRPKKKHRSTFTNEQLSELERYYTTKTFLSIEDRPILSKRLGLKQQQVKTWFQNRRMKEKRQKRGNNEYNMCATRLSFQQSQTVEQRQYSSYPEQFPMAVSKQVFDPTSFMRSYGPVSPITYQQPFCTGFSSRVSLDFHG